MPIDLAIGIANFNANVAYHFFLSEGLIQYPICHDIIFKGLE